MNIINVQVTVTFMTAITESDLITRQRHVLKLGGVLAFVGGLAYFMTLLVHGDLPDQTTEIALNHIARRPEWPTLKLTLIASIMMWVGAFIALASSLTRGASWLLSRMAAACLMIGAAVVVVEYSILGYEIKRLADAWQAATSAEREHLVLIAETQLAVTNGLFLSFIAWLLGLPYVLMGLAVALDGRYGSWLGWLAVAGGTGAFFTGVTRFLGMTIVPFPVLYGGFIIPLNLWLAGMGLAMWRQGGRRI
jgi:hypothetical protein